MAEINPVRLADLERFYRENRDRYAIGVPLHHFNAGRLAAIADLRRELQEHDKESFRLNHERKTEAH